jgi:hypothetical protein
MNTSCQARARKTAAGNYPEIIPISQESAGFEKYNAAFTRQSMNELAMNGRQIDSSERCDKRDRAISATKSFTSKKNN